MRFFRHVLVDSNGECNVDLSSVYALHTPDDVWCYGSGIFKSSETDD